MNAECELHALRIKLESTLEAPMRIAVTCATNEDLAPELAFALGGDFVAAGRSVALVRLEQMLDGKGASPVRLAALPALGSTSGPRFDLLRISAPSAPAHTQNIEALLANARGAYDVTVVDASLLPAASGALEAVALADGVLVAVRIGRRVGRLDDDFLAALERISAKVVGAVTTAPDAMAPYGERLRRACELASAARPLDASDLDGIRVRPPQSAVWAEA